MPPTITVDQIKGFSLFMIKAVLDGRVAGRYSTSPNQPRELRAGPPNENAEMIGDGSIPN
jgi:hypothetical protein